MGTEQYLNQLRDMKRRIACKRRDAQMWRSIAESLSVPLDGDRVQSTGSGDKMAESVAKAVDCEREIDKLTFAMLKLQEEIMKRIDSMENYNHSIILSEYYVHGMSLNKISIEWGRSVRHLKRVKSEAIASFGEKFGDKY